MLVFAQHGVAITVTQPTRFSLGVLQCSYWKEEPPDSIIIILSGGSSFQAPE